MVHERSETETQIIIRILLVCPILQNINCLNNSKLISTHTDGHTHTKYTKQKINNEHLKEW
jgi:hypothetical protein